MPSTTDISPLSITDGKISNEARIAHAKLAKATEGQILVAQSNGKFAAKSLAGDVTLDASGNTTSNVAVSTDGTTVVTGATGAKGDTGSTGSQGATGATGAAGTDATVTETTVNAAGAVMHTDFPSTGFIKRGASEAAYTIDNSTYSTDGHSHTLSDVTDSGTSAALDVPATGNAASGEVVKGSDTRLTDTRTPSSTLVHKSTHATGGGDVLSPSDIGASASGHTHDHDALTNYAVGQHRVINDSGTSSTELWSASNVNYHLGGKEPTIGSKNTAFNKNFGAASGDVCQGNDGRLSDARTPSSTLTHKATHATGAADALSPADIGASASGHTHAYSSLTSIPSTFAPSAHTHSHADLTSIDANQHLDWTTDRGSTNIHAGNYTDTTYSIGDGGLTQKNFTTADNTKLDACLEVDDAGGSTTSNTWSASKIASNALYAAANFSPVDKYTATVTGDASGTTIFYVTHNLGTYYVVVSVRHPIITGTSATSIDEMFDEDQYTLMDVGHSVAPGVEVATINALGNVCDNCIAIRFPSAPADGDEYLVTIIG